MTYVRDIWKITFTLAPNKAEQCLPVVNFLRLNRYFGKRGGVVPAVAVAKIHVQV